MSAAAREFKIRGQSRQTITAEAVEYPNLPARIDGPSKPTSRTDTVEVLGPNLAANPSEPTSPNTGEAPVPNPTANPSETRSTVEDIDEAPGPNLEVSPKQINPAIGGPNLAASTRDSYKPSTVGGPSLADSTRGPSKPTNTADAWEGPIMTSHPSTASPAATSDTGEVPGPNLTANPCKPSSADDSEAPCPNLTANPSKPTSPADTDEASDSNLEVSPKQINPDTVGSCLSASTRDFSKTARGPTLAMGTRGPSKPTSTADAWEGPILTSNPSKPTSLSDTDKIIGPNLTANPSKPAIPVDTNEGPDPNLTANLSKPTSPAEAPDPNLTVSPKQINPTTEGPSLAANIRGLSKPTRTADAWEGLILTANFSKPTSPAYQVPVPSLTVSTRGPSKPEAWEGPILTGNTDGPSMPTSSTDAGEGPNLAANKVDKCEPFDQSKLVLVLDLDHTLLRSYYLNELTANETHLLDPSSDLVSRHPTLPLIIKLRPFVKTFLKEAHVLFDLFIYTTGLRSYAEGIATILDPNRIYFNDYKIICRDDTSRYCYEKSLEFIPRDHRHVLIVDDTEKVWMQHRDNLILIEKYKYFTEWDDPTALKEETDDALVDVLDVLRQAHTMFFNDPDHVSIPLPYRDVRPILKKIREQQSLAKGGKNFWDLTSLLEGWKTIKKKVREFLHCTPFICFL